jgi:hypothetical protein
MGARIGGEDKSNADVRGVTDRVWDMIRMERMQPGANDLSIDLVMDISGPFYTVDYPSIRTGRLWRRDRVLQIQVPIPVGLGEEQAWAFFDDALARVFELADEYIEDHRLGYSLDSLRQVIDRVRERIRLRSD